MRTKTKESTVGYKSGCHDYSPCPLCFGCRNYDSSYYKCVSTCGQNKKRDICNRQKHTESALNLMIKPSSVSITEKRKEA